MVAKADHSLETRRLCRRHRGYASLCSEARQVPDSQEAKVDQEVYGHLFSARTQGYTGQLRIRVWESKQGKAEIQEVWKDKIIVPMPQKTEKSPILRQGF